MTKRVHNPTKPGRHNVPFLPMPKEVQIGDRVVEDGKYTGTVTKERYEKSNGYDMVDIQRDGEDVSWGYCICNYGSTWWLLSDKKAAEWKPKR